jgi:hypothetical protein
MRLGITSVAAESETRDPVDNVVASRKDRDTVAAVAFFNIIILSNASLSAY